jgi:hypothetical protein
MKFETKCALSAQEVRKSSRKVCEVYMPRVCTAQTVMHKVEHEHTLCKQFTLLHNLGRSVLRAARRCWMARAQRHNMDRLSTLEQRQRLLILAHGVMERSGVVETRRDVWMVRAQRRIPDHHARTEAAPACTGPWLDGARRDCRDTPRRLDGQSPAPHP